MLEVELLRSLVVWLSVIHRSRTGLALALAALALAAPALPARAMVAVSLFRAPLRQAAQAAAACPDVVDGRYVVRIDIGTDGRGRGAELLDSPRITLLAEECIERAFTTQTYPGVGPGPRSQEHIYMSFPFIVSGRPAP